MSYLYTDNADVLLWRGSEVAACPTRFTNRTDDQRQQDLYSRKSTELVYRRGAVAWRLALFETFTARADGVRESTVLRRKSRICCAPSRLRFARALLDLAEDGAPRRNQLETTGYFFSRM